MQSFLIIKDKLSMAQNIKKRFVNKNSHCLF